MLGGRCRRVEVQAAPIGERSDLRHLLVEYPRGNSRDGSHGLTALPATGHVLNW